MANHYQPMPAKARAMACPGQQRLWPYMAMAWALGLGLGHGPWLAMANHDLSSACSQLCPSVVAYSLRGGVAQLATLWLCRCCPCLLSCSLCSLATRCPDRILCMFIKQIYSKALLLSRRSGFACTAHSSFQGGVGIHSSFQG